VSQLISNVYLRHIRHTIRMLLVLAILLWRLGRGGLSIDGYGFGDIWWIYVVSYEL
jgi:hypothetical protein